MKPAGATVFLLASVLALAGCSRETGEPPQQATEPAASAAAAPAPDGAALYAVHCAQCHEGQALRAPHRTIAGLMAGHRIVAALESGVMMEQGKSLSAAERVAIAEFLTGAPYTAPAGLPENLWCAAGSSDFNVGAPPDTDGWGVDHANHHLYPAPGLDSAAVPRLQPAWAFAFPDAIRARSKPVVAGGALFVGSHDGTVYALDQKSGCIRWTYRANAEVRTGIVIDQWQAGDESASPGLYFGDLNGNVYALDARSGELRWRDRPDEHPSLTITAAPVLFEGKLYVALSSLEVTAAANPDYACCTFRGGVIAYEAAGGKRLWLQRVIEQEAADVGSLPNGTRQLAPSGAPVWGTPSLDVKRRRLYLGTGENYSSPSDDRSDAIFALDLDDGHIAWHWQATGGDAWNMGCETPDRAACPPENGPDFDFGAATIFVERPTGDILLAGQKSGQIHALDAENGQLIWQRKLGRGGIQGGIHFGMSVEGDTVFAPVSDFFGGPRWPGEGKPGLYALDIANGEIRWNQPSPDACNGRELCDPGISAAISGIPGVVFAGGMDGRLRAHDTASGEMVWEFDAAREFDALGGMQARGGSFGGAAAPVFADGMMYVVSGYGLYNHMPGNLLMAFKVD